MTYASNLYFSGEFNREAFTAAIGDALDRHPLLCALVRPAKQKKLCWVSPEGATPFIEWGSFETPMRMDQGEAIDLSREVGLRAWIRQGDGRAHLVLQFHHACCDGTGAHRFIGDLLAAYGIRTAEGDRRPVMASYDPQLLKDRRSKLADYAVISNTTHGIRRGIGQGVHVFGRRISPLKTNGKSKNTLAAETAFPGVVSHTFDRDEHKALRTAANRLGCMLNDLLVSSIFCKMREWNIDHGSSGRQNLRIMMPTDMRDKYDYAMPAANMTCYNFITRKMSECLDEAKLIKSIRDETARIKHEQRGKHFIESVMICNSVPGLLPFLLSRQRCLSTVTVSNMGDPTRRFLATFPRQAGKLVCGDVVLEKMLGVSPLRPKTRAAISIVNFYRQLIINVRCDPHTMSLQDAQEFLNGYVNRLKSHL